MSRICLYFRNEPERDRWIPGDRFVRPLARRILRGRPRVGGVGKVFKNLCLGLDRLKIPYEVNLPFRLLRASDRVGILGVGRHCLDGYRQPNPIVAGIGLMTHPSEWPTLCDDFPVVRYLQHSKWAADVYRPYFGDRVALWPVGIETDAWTPSADPEKRFDFLIYDKICWNRERLVPRLLNSVKQQLDRRGLKYTYLRYGAYDEPEYRRELRSSRAMIFICAHESQGIAYQECLSSNVPVLAWDPQSCLDPNRFAWGSATIPATSVPFFSSECGLKFKDIGEFPTTLAQFLDIQSSGAFSPRDYILKNLSLEHCSKAFLQILSEAQQDGTNASLTAA